MPFENITTAPHRIAVIGGGVSGMGAAYALSRNHQVTLFESNRRMGGHARTVMSGKNGDQPVDTGFIVFNRPNYPHLARMFDALDVPIVNSNMSFGISANDGEVEYSTARLSATFAQRRNLVNPAFYGMLRDINRFNTHAISAARCPDLSLGDFMHQLGLGRWFQNYYLLPITGAIWSTPLQKMMDFPAKTLVQFFDNHNLLNYSGQHQWLTVKGGSQQYVNRLVRALRQNQTDIRLSAPVKSVRRTANGVQLRALNGVWEDFDRVVFACHSDEALAMLETPSAREKSILSRLRYQDNHAVLHCDASVMPKRRACWSSWVYTSSKNTRQDRIGVTYWMNNLQPIPQDDLLLETLNPNREIREDLIYEEKNFRHPVFDAPALRAQQEMKAIQGVNNTWFCGAYLGAGFHEDGFASGIKVADMMAQVPAWA